MSEIEKMQRYINRTKLDHVSGFCLNLEEAFELAARAMESRDIPVEVISLAFNYGRAKGYRAAQKAGRRA